MGTPDTVTKSFLSNPEVFADVCNFCIFEGKKVITAEQLTEKDTAKYVVVSGEEEIEEAIQKQRDVQKLYTTMTDGKMNYVMLGVENQQAVHYAMPARIMMYDAIDYQMQIKAITDKYKTERDWGINFWPDKKIIPCVNIVVYYGTKEWDAARDLIDMMQTEDLPQEIQRFINPYPIYVVSPATMTDEEIQRFQSDMRMVMLFIKNSNDKKKARELVLSDPGFKSIAREAIDVIRATTNSDFTYKIEEGGRVNMCKALNEWIADEREDAKEKAEKAARAEAEKKARESAKSMYADNLPLENISKYLGYTVETIKGWLGIQTA